MHSKSDEFSQQLQQTAAIAKALSHPARLAILKHLAEKRSCYSGNIADELPLSRTTVSQHLQELKRSGLIQGEIEGTRICYCIDGEVFLHCKNMLTSFFSDVEASGVLDAPTHEACSTTHKKS